MILDFCRFVCFGHFRFFIKYSTDMTPEFIQDCIQKARQNQSQCTSHILQLDGMSGNMTRHLYNNICSFKKTDGTPTRYLEIGCWKGSSTTSALHGNTHLVSTVVDNWSEFDGPKNDFHVNIGPYKGESLQIVEEDSFHPDILQRLAHAPYDIYLYDGCHLNDSHEKAITRLWDALADTCIILIDDYDWEIVREGTRKGLEAVNANVVYQTSVSSPNGRDGFWNGCGIFLIRK